MPYLTETELSNYFQTIDQQAARIAELEMLLKQSTEIIVEKNSKILDLKNNKGVFEMVAEIERLTAANEAMQEDAVQNTYALFLFKELNDKQANDIRELAEENRGLRQMLNMEAK